VEAVELANKILMSFMGLGNLKPEVKEELGYE